MQIDGVHFTFCYLYFLIRKNKMTQMFIRLLSFNSMIRDQ